MKIRNRVRTSASLLAMLSFVVPSLATAASLPKEVSAYIGRRNDCDHFRGEASPDTERQAEIDRELRRLCAGSDAELARLLRLHAKNKAVRDALGVYDPDIEMDSLPR